MEADIYDAVHSALLPKGSKRLRLNLGSTAVCRVHKVIWSVWDYIIGPDVNFVWEVEGNVSKSPTPLRSASPTSNCSNPIRSGEEENVIVAVEIHNCSRCGLLKCQCSSEPPTTADLEEKSDPSDQRLLEDVRELSFDSSEITTGLEDDAACESAKVVNFTSEAVEQSAMINEDRRDSELTDESYVALHSLSSEICRLRVETTAVDFKLLCLPDRQLLIVSFIFSAKHKDTQSVQSISMVLSDSSWLWYQQYERLIEDWLGQIVQRIKAALFVDTFEEILSGITSDLTDLLTHLSFLDLNGLHTLKFNISETLLASTNLSSDEFLRSCISAHLVSQGHTVVVGRDVKPVNQMIRTLALFSPNSDWSYSHYAVDCSDISFSPYLCIQGLKADQMKFISERGPLSIWPWCLINMDTRKLQTSEDFATHYQLRSQSIVQTVERDLGLECETPVKLTWKSYRCDDSLVLKFLQQMDLLSQDCDVLKGFVDHFCLTLMYKGIALVDYTEEITGFGMDPSKLNLPRLRKALDLALDGDFGAVLATADRLKPNLAAFVHKLGLPS